MIWYIGMWSSKELLSLTTITTQHIIFADSAELTLIS